MFRQPWTGDTTMLVLRPIPIGRLPQVPPWSVQPHAGSGLPDIPKPPPEEGSKIPVDSGWHPQIPAPPQDIPSPQPKDIAQPASNKELMTYLIFGLSIYGVIKYLQK